MPKGWLLRKVRVLWGPIRAGPQYYVKGSQRTKKPGQLKREKRSTEPQKKKESEFPGRKARALKTILGGDNARKRTLREVKRQKIGEKE